MTVKTSDRQRPRASLTIRARLMLGFLVVLFFLFASGLVQVVALRQLDRALAASQRETERMTAAMEVGRVSGHIVAALAGVAYAEDLEGFVAAIAQTRQELGAAVVDLDAAVQDLPLLDPVRNAAFAVQSRTARIDSLSDLIVPAAQAGEWDKVRYYQSELLTTYNRLVSLSIEEIVARASERQLVATREAAIARQIARLVPPVFVVLALVVAAVTSLATVRGVAGPVEQLTEAASRIAARQFGERVPVERSDELGRLALAFNEMAGQLQSLYGELERRVDERTADLRRRTAQLQAAAQVASKAAEISDVQALLDETVRLISDRFGYHHAAIYLLDEAKDYAVLRAASSEGGRRMLAQGYRMAATEGGIISHVIATGRPRIAGTASEEGLLRATGLEQTNSEMVLPLKIRGETIGVLDVQSTEVAAFSDEDIAVLQTVADQIALAIGNARLLAEAQDRLRQITVLLGQSGREGWRRLASERPDWRYVYDGIEVREGGAAEVAPATQIRMPLRVRQDVIGQLSLSLRDRFPSAEDEALVQAVVEQAGLALESARLFQDTQRTLAEIEALYAANRRLTTAITVEDVANAIVDCVADTEADGCVVVQFDYAETGEPEALVYLRTWRRARQPEFQSGLRLPVAQSPFPFEMLSRFWSVSDVQMDASLPESARRVFLDTGVLAVTNVPLRSRERVIGQVVVLREQPEPFSSGAIRLYEMLSDQAAVALERAQLLEATRRTAEYQQHLATITSRVRASAHIDTILQTAIREIGRTLRLSEGLIELRIPTDGQEAVEES